MPSARVVRVVNVIFNGAQARFKVHLSSTKGPGSAGVSVVDSDSGRYTHWRTFRYKRVFIGLSPDEPRKKAKAKAAGSLWWHGGNSVLLLLASRKATYVYIGPEIYAFSPPDEILSFVSPMGVSTVPYPHAVGRDNTYLMLLDTFVPNDLLVTPSDPYQSYASTDLTTGRPSTSDRAKTVWRAAHMIPGRVLLHGRV